MINRVVLVGRLTKDLELRKTPQGTSNVTFNLACDRSYKKDGQPNADFIQCVAWRQGADFLSQYAKKGTIVGIDGRIQTRTYEGDHGTVYITEVVAENVRILNNTQHKETKATEKSTFRTDEVTEETDDLPFY